MPVGNGAPSGTYERLTTAGDSDSKTEMMKTKGYLRKTQDAELLHRNLRRLGRAGIPLADITVGGNILPVIDSLESGDCLVVLSVADLSLQPARQKMLLGRIAEKGITFRPLDRAGARHGDDGKGWLAGWLCRLGLRHVRTGPPPAPAPQMGGELQARVVSCLIPYYQLTKGVETICTKAGISLGAFYQFLRENNLPSRRDVKANPKLNPLHKPGFPGMLFLEDPGAENPG